MKPDYDKVGLLTLRAGRMLLCRKQSGTQLLILPGGKREPGESALECLERELREELGAVRMTQPLLLGVYEDRAAGEASKTVRVELYTAELEGEPVASSEIAGLVWFGAGNDETLLAPSLRNRILPDLRARGMVTF